MRIVALAVAMFAAISLFFITEGHTSFRGEVSVTRREVRVQLTTPYKRPMRGDEEDYKRHLAEWSAENEPIAEKAATAIEAVLPRHRARLGIVPDGFGTPGLASIDSEGIGVATSDQPWRLEIHLELFGRGSTSSTATIVLAKRPSRSEVRALSRDVMTAALASMGKKLPAYRYTAYWLTSSEGAPRLLLTAVPLAKLEETLREEPFREIGYVTFRRSPVLLVTLDDRKRMAPNRAGYLLANATSGTVSADGTTISLQTRSEEIKGATLRKATRADVKKLFTTPTDPSSIELSRDGVEFVGTLELAP